MIYIAHRGASGDYPENTLLAFRKAQQSGANWMELDVHLSADGKLMVIHDERLERTTSGKGLVGDFTADELQRLDAGQGERIPLLRDVLDLITGSSVLNVELKGRGSAEPTATLLEGLIESRRLSAENLLVSSLDLSELAKFNRACPHIRTAAVYDQLPQDLWQQVEAMKFWSLHVELNLVSEMLVQEAHRRGVRLFVFTVNHFSEANRLRALGVDGIFTDYPDMAERAE